MSKASLLSLLLMAALAAVGAGCGDDGGGDSGSGSGGGDGDGDGDGECTPDIEERNFACPEVVTPQEGCYANKGECCYRRSNTIRRQEAAAAGETTGRMEFRINYSLPTNHPNTLGTNAIKATAQNRGDKEQQSLLWAFEGPIDAEGNDMDGEGFTYIGQGVYNCDGTYSYYSDKAAKDRVASATDPAYTDKSRWLGSKMPSTIDTSKTGVDRSYVKWVDRERGRRFSYSPYLADVDYTLDWELISMGFDIKEFDTTEDENCFGSRNGETNMWDVKGDYIAFTPVLVNNHDDISTISQTFCQLMGFSIVAVTDDMPDLPQCDGPRCMPGTEGCPWVKLPDSLCPLDPVTGELDEAEADKWGCHVGYENNPDSEPTNCTPDAPTGVLDPDMGADNEGQCCDPLGESDTLPACNAWIIHNEFVAAAAEITDEPTDELQGNCLVSAAP